MKLKSDRESRRGKSRVSNDGNDRCGTVIDENLKISSGSDYEPGEEGDEESEGNVSLEEKIRDFEKGECSSSSEEDEDDEEGAVEQRRTKYGKRKRVGLIEGRRWRQKAAGDGVVNDVDVIP